MQNRNSGIDFIKLFLALLIIIYHAGLPYFIGPNGYWYFRSATYNNQFFIPWYFSFNAFVLNTFFFIAGIFSYFSLKKHKSLLFLNNRIKRILIPLLLGFLFILPPLGYYYYVHYEPVQHTTFIHYLFSYWFGLTPKPTNWVGHYPDMNLGHLWFLEHLLIYSIILIILLYIADKISFNIKLHFSYYVSIILLTSILCTFVMHMYYPVTEMSSFLGFIQVDFTHVLQNCILFFGGVYFAKSDFLNQMKYPIKKLFFFIGIFSALLPFIVYYWIHNFEVIFSQLALFTIWESFTAVTVAIGLVSYLNSSIKIRWSLLNHIAGLSYTMYIIHIVFVVVFQILIENIIQDPIIKFILVSICSIVASIIGAYLVDLINKIFSNLILTKKDKIIS